MRHSSEGKGKKPLKERIGSAAILYKKEIFTGTNHGEAWGKMTKKYPESATENDSGHGFVTTKGRFVDREEALQIAQSAGQTKELLDTQDVLFAHDLKEKK